MITVVFDQQNAGIIRMAAAHPDDGIGRWHADRVVRDCAPQRLTARQRTMLQHPGNPYGQARTASRPGSPRQLLYTQRNIFAILQ